MVLIDFEEIYSQTVAFEIQKILTQMVNYEIQEKSLKMFSS